MRYYDMVESIPNNGALRQTLMKFIFGDEQLQGARWDVPGYSEISSALDVMGITRSLKSFNINLGDDVIGLDPEQRHDIVLSMVYGKEEMQNLGPDTPGLALLSSGLAKQGIRSQDGQLALRGQSYGDPFDAINCH